MTTPTVTILTYCAHPALAYGTLLVFKSLRTGFPTARVEVYDNGSHPEVRDQIMRACTEVDAEFTAMAQKHYADHFRWLLLRRELGAEGLVILDPDVIFWHDVERWTFADSLLAGRLIPEVGNDVVTVHPRLHPSFLWVPDVARLRAELAARWPSEADGRWNLIGPTSERVGTTQRIFDTMAPLYEALRDRSHAFTESELDAYDHLFFGSHFPLLEANGIEGFDVMREGHRLAATGQLEQLRGIWRKQEDWFCNPRHVATTEAQRRANLAPASQLVESWQGTDSIGSELHGAMKALQMRFALVQPSVGGGPRPAT